MKVNRRSLFGGIALALALAAGIGFLLAACSPETAASAAAKKAAGEHTAFRFTGEGEEAPIDVVLLLDVSGSMRTEDHAMERVRDEAARSFLELLPEDACASLVYFDTSVVDDLNTALLPVNSELDTLLSVVESSEGYDYEGKRTDPNTYPGPAISRAIQVLDSEGRSNSNKYIVMFSDGVPEGVYYHKVDAAKTEKAWQDMVNTARAAKSRGIGFYVVHSPRGDGGSDEATVEEELQKLCAALNTGEAITESNIGVTASVTEWAGGELGKVIAIDDLKDLSSSFLNLFFALKNYRTCSMTIPEGGGVTTFSLPSGMESVSLYLETGDLSLAGHDASFAVQSVTNQDTGTEYDVTLERTTSHGKRYRLPDRMPGGTYLVEVKAGSEASVVVMGRYAFTVDVNLAERFSPQRRDNLTITVNGASGDRLLGLAVELVVDSYDAEGTLIKTETVSDGIPLSSLSMSSGDSGVTLAVRPQVTAQGVRLACQDASLTMTLGDDPPVMVGTRAYTVLRFWDKTVALGRASDLAYDTEDAPELLTYVSEADSIRFYVGEEDGVLYAVYQGLPVMESFTAYCCDSSGNRSEVVKMEILGFPLGPVILLAVIAALAALGAERYKVWKKQEEERKRREAEEASTPWYGSVAWTETVNGAVCAVGALSEFYPTHQRAAQAAFRRRCGVENLHEQQVYDGKGSRVPSCLSGKGIRIQAFEYRGGLNLRIVNAGDAVVEQQDGNGTFGQTGERLFRVRSGPLCLKLSHNEEYSVVLVARHSPRQADNLMLGELAE